MRRALDILDRWAGPVFVGGLAPCSTITPSLTVEQPGAATTPLRTTKDPR